jgi:hypothetical protein
VSARSARNYFYEQPPRCSSVEGTLPEPVESVGRYLGKAPPRLHAGFFSQLDDINTDLAANLLPKCVGCRIDPVDAPSVEF